jgi:hypothetical protein
MQYVQTAARNGHNYSEVNTNRRQPPQSHPPTASSCVFSEWTTRRDHPSPLHPHKRTIPRSVRHVTGVTRRPVVTHPTERAGVEAPLLVAVSARVQLWGFIWMWVFLTRHNTTLARNRRPGRTQLTLPSVLTRATSLGHPTSSCSNTTPHQTTSQRPAHHTLRNSNQKTATS